MMNLNHVNYSITSTLLDPTGNLKTVDRSVKAYDPRLIVVGLVALMSGSSEQVLLWQQKPSVVYFIDGNNNEFTTFKQFQQMAPEKIPGYGKSVDQFDWTAYNDGAAETAVAYIPFTAKTETAAGGEFIMTDEDRKIINDIVNASNAKLDASIRELAAEIRGLRDLTQSEIRGLRDVLQVEVKRLDQAISLLKWVIGTIVIGIGTLLIKTFLHGS